MSVLDYFHGERRVAIDNKIKSSPIFDSPYEETWIAGIEVRIYDRAILIVLWKGFMHGIARKRRLARQKSIPSVGINQEIVNRALDGEKLIVIYDGKRDEVHYAYPEDILEFYREKGKASIACYATNRVPIIAYPKSRLYRYHDESADEVMKNRISHDHSAGHSVSVRPESEGLERWLG